MSAGAATPADLLLSGGTLIDGSGAPPLRADVAVRDGHIDRVGTGACPGADRVIDAEGLVVAPGFIDVHSHADLIFLADRSTQERLLEARLRQGVTSVLVGNCGLGVAPSTAAGARLLGDVNGWMTPAGVRAGALTVGQYLDRLAAGGVLLYVGTLVPHGPLRFSAMGAGAGRPSADELRAMRSALGAGLEAGAFGVSAGLIYPPGMFSDTDELVALAEVVAQTGRLFTSHVRGSSETLIPATEELLEIGRRSGVRVHHSHLEAVGQRFWPDVLRVLDLEDRARAEGLRVSHDVFPYTRAATMMSAIFPPWALEGGVPALLERLADEKARARIRRDVEHRRPEWPPWAPGGWPHNLVEAVGWDGILVASVGANGSSAHVGRTVSELAAEQQRDPFDVVADLMLQHGGQVGQLVDQISGREEDPGALRSILTHPAAAVVSDAEDYGRGAPHPAHAGAFARALRWARERDWMPVEEVVRRMTAYPAALFGLDGRGRIAPGAHADLVLFDPGRVTDRAGWSDPRRHADGIPWVFVNGRAVVEEGRFVGGLHGRVLRA